MGSEGGDDSVVAVADALTLRQQVDSDRCAGLVTPAHRRVLDSLCTDIAVICTRTALVLGSLAIAIPEAGRRRTHRCGSGYRVNDRVSVRGTTAYGTGAMMLQPGADMPIETGLSMAMAAAGSEKPGRWRCDERRPRNDRTI